MKLMGAVGAIVGPYGALVAGLLAILVGGVYALGAMCFQWGVIATGRKLVCATRGAFWRGREQWTQELKLPFRLRYGLAIVGGTLLFVVGSPSLRGIGILQFQLWLIEKAMRRHESERTMSQVVLIEEEERQ